MRSYYIYIMMSFSGVLYIGVTNKLYRRVKEHKEGKGALFAKKYRCKKLVYFEMFENIEIAILREKKLKKWNRKKKLNLIGILNPEYSDLFENMFRR